jgi:beta-glucosidase
MKNSIYQPSIKTFIVLVLIFITSFSYTQSIYHTNWIDLNKNGQKDIYEDSGQSIDIRVADLISQMTMEEKTAQMVTL